MIIKTLALATMRQALRAKILYGVVLFAVLIFMAASLFGSVSIGDNIRVIKDFGLFSISLMSVLYTIVAGASLLHNELSKKTIYNIMSKPIYRWQFVLGKFFGLVIVSCTLVIMMAVFLTSYLFLWEGFLDFKLFYAYVYIMFEMVLLSAFVIFFSAIVVTPFLSGMFVAGVFIVGRCSTYLLDMARMSGNSVTEFLYYFVPHLQFLWVADDVVFGRLPSVSHSFSAIIYVISYSAALLCIAIIAFQRREFN